jgi:hypothetical protein
MESRNDNSDLWGKPIHVYTRAQAIADGILVDFTTAKDDRGQLLCQQAGFKIPVAITRTAWAKTVEAGGTWTPTGDGDALELMAVSHHRALLGCSLDAEVGLWSGERHRPGSFSGVGGRTRRWPS